MSVIRFNEVTKAFGDHQVLSGITFEVEAGDVHFLMGGSGAGKSVIIKHIVGLLRPDSGGIWLDGQDICGLTEPEFAPIRRRAQMIFQHATLFDSMTVLENVAMPIQKRFRVRGSEARERAVVALRRVHAEALLDRHPPDLGAGVRKRVAIARAIALEPEILLYDEPTTGLDPVAARRTDRLIAEMASELGITSVVVSHDLESMAGIADQVAFVGEGRIIYHGSPAGLPESGAEGVVEFMRAGSERWKAGGERAGGGGC